MALTLVALLAACGGGSSTQTVAEEPEAQVATPKSATAAVDVGEALFKDPALSASGRMACATCHDELFGHADKPGTQLPLGGLALLSAGMRSSPTGRYLNQSIPFRLEADGTPIGGFTWDGRVDSRRAQARAPFFESAEMALPGSPESPGALLDLVRKASYFSQLTALYTPTEVDTDTKLFKRIVELIEIYQRDDADYNLFDSRYDQSLAGTATLSDSEQRGLEIFRNPGQGNCASCHSASGTQPLFTNFGYAALGVPRNHAAPKNVDPAFFDLGLCARKKTSDAKVQGVARYCGQFKTPTLRNVTRTAPYFHNGAVATLEEAVRFHFTRDTDATRWYRRADNTADAPYNDLPLAYRANLSRGQPFAGAWVPTPDQMIDLLAFLATLDDADQITPLR